MNELPEQNRFYFESAFEKAMAQGILISAWILKILMLMILMAWGGSLGENTIIFKLFTYKPQRQCNEPQKDKPVC